jgi:hypothetical protein
MAAAKPAAVSAGFIVKVVHFIVGLIKDSLINAVGIISTHFNRPPGREGQKG